MKEVKWEVLCPRAIPVFRYCKKCGKKKLYKSSGLFRVNAQRKSLDVWLIYKCTVCDDTWNMTVLSRVAPAAIGRERLEQFYANDPVLAQQYAMNAELLKQNGAEVGVPDYEIIGEAVPAGEEVRLRIGSPAALPIKAAAVLRKKLCLSQREFEQFCTEGNIREENGRELKKCRLSAETVLLLNLPDSAAHDAGRSLNEDSERCSELYERTEGMAPAK
jgi:Uncharacterized protein conserved in bacteria